MARHASREPQYAHLNARAKRRDTRVATGRMRLRGAHGATLARPQEAGRQRPRQRSGRIRSPIR
ncbi:hypothetical protein C5615_17300 [Burkholderia cepacia]|uniref:Uncharacterized protein n=1 Tax=Burkholderia cepacia TaxID=292 RepID=A0A2S8IR24_BURCE|nr:hypothetical protein C5615_17300 [Burkholderia cepacia]